MFSSHVLIHACACVCVLFLDPTYQKIVLFPTPLIKRFCYFHVHTPNVLLSPETTLMMHSFSFCVKHGGGLLSILYSKIICCNHNGNCAGYIFCRFIQLYQFGGRTCDGYLQKLFLFVKHLCIIRSMCK